MCVSYNLEIRPNSKPAKGGWKNGTRKPQIRGGKLSADENAVEEFKSFLHRLIVEEGISEDQLYIQLWREWFKL